MNCESCGTPINEGQTSCYKCGAPVLPELVQTEEKDKVLIDLTAAEQTIPPFVHAPGSEPEIQADTTQTQTPANQPDAPQKVASATAEIPVISTVQHNTYKKSAAQKPVKRVNVCAFIGLFLGVAIMLIEILTLLKLLDISYLHIGMLIAWIASFVFSLIGLVIKGNKPIAIISIIICVLHIVLFYFIVRFILMPEFFERIKDMLPPPMPGVI
ncbi:MAG: hypothetical protein K5665_03240 [Saccharofermentans sp.]|nr:hypothetical protein [Saccharofermentans sp.]